MPKRFLKYLLLFNVLGSNEQIIAELYHQYWAPNIYFMRALILSAFKFNGIVSCDFNAN